jgi:hypothetical protein
MIVPGLDEYRDLVLMRELCGGGGPKSEEEDGGRRYVLP